MADCPSCGAPNFTRGFCRECGYDESLADAEDGYLDGIELPDPDEDDYAYEQQWGTGRENVTQQRPAWITVGILLALAAMAVFTGLFALLRS